MRDSKRSPDQYLSPYEHDTWYSMQCFQQRAADWLSLWHSRNVTHDTLKLYSSFFSLYCQETRRGEKQERLNFSLTLTHILSLIHTNIHTSRPVKLRVGLSAAYNKLLENAVLPVFFLLVFAMCVWSCACIEKKKRRKWKSACVCTVCVSVSELHRETNRHVWYVCVCVHCSGCGLDRTD